MDFLEKHKNRLIITLLILILTAGIIIRFINFRQSVYFGYDEARDAFISQEIYTKGDFKLIGPQASIFEGIHHGPIYYYLIGPLFLLGKGDPYFVSIFFRLINAFGIVGVFTIGTLFFEPLIGLLSAFIYAFSYEQFIYAIFTGNPSLSDISWIIMFIGAGILYRYKNKKILGLTLLFLGPSLAAQFDLMSGFSFLVAISALYLMKEKIKTISLKKWIFILGIGLSPLYTYVLAEIKFKFIATKTIIQILSSNTSIVRAGESIPSIVISNFLNLFRDNILGSFSNKYLAAFFSLILISYLAIKGRKDKKYYIFAIWILSLVFFVFTRGFMPFYSYAGVGIGVIIGFAILISKILKKSLFIGILLLTLIATGSLVRIIYQSSRSLIVDIKAQPGMRLLDEITIINKTYTYTKGQAFTIRVTSMPYKIQTVWAYLYNQYGLKKYGYLPLYETGNVFGFPGNLPSPKKGTTCLRFLIREPIRGIPENLIAKDETEENYFSNITKTEYIGNFILETRKAKGPNCHND